MSPDPKNFKIQSQSQSFQNSIQILGLRLGSYGIGIPMLTPGPDLSVAEKSRHLPDI